MGSIFKVARIIACRMLCEQPLYMIRCQLLNVSEIACAKSGKLRVMNILEYVSTLLGPLQFIFQGDEVRFPGPTFQTSHSDYSSYSTERTRYTLTFLVMHMPLLPLLTSRLHLFPLYFYSLLFIFIFNHICSYFLP
jgi:hypothetical protein